MEAVRAYLLSVTGAALVCAVASRFFGKKSTGAVGKMIAGLILVLTILHPLADFSVDILDDFSFHIEQGSANAVGQGKEETQKALAQIIKEKTASYILQKAQALHADVAVEIMVTDDAVPVPEAVRISGNIAPYAKQQLQALITHDLGIAKENQIWI